MRDAVYQDLRGQLMTVLVDCLVENSGVAPRGLIEMRMVTAELYVWEETGVKHLRKQPPPRQEADEFIVSVGSAGFALMNNDTMWIDPERLQTVAALFMTDEQWRPFLESPLFLADRSMLVPSPLPLPRGSGMKLPVVRIVQDLTLALDNPDRYTGIVLPASINPDGTDKFDLEPPRELPAAFPALPGQWVFDPAPWLAGWDGVRAGSPWLLREQETLQWMIEAAGPGRVVEAWRRFAAISGRSLNEVMNFGTGRRSTSPPQGTRIDSDGRHLWKLFTYE